MHISGYLLLTAPSASAAAPSARSLSSLSCLMDGCQRACSCIRASTAWRARSSASVCECAFMYVYVRFLCMVLFDVCIYHAYICKRTYIRVRCECVYVCQYTCVYTWMHTNMYVHIYSILMETTRNVANKCIHASGLPQRSPHTLLLLGSCIYVCIHVHT